MSRLIYRTDRPDMIGARVLPMTEHDRLWPHTKAIARHRIETLERAAEVADAEKWGERHVAAADRDGNTDPATYNEACNDIAAAIRALKGKSDE